MSIFLIALKVWFIPTLYLNLRKGLELLETKYEHIALFPNIVVMLYTSGKKAGTNYNKIFLTLHFLITAGRNNTFSLDLERKCRAKTHHIYCNPIVCYVVHDDKRSIYDCDPLFANVNRMTYPPRIISGSRDNTQVVPQHLHFSHAAVSK